MHSQIVVDLLHSKQFKYVLVRSPSGYACGIQNKSLQLLHVTVVT